MLFLDFKMSQEFRERFVEMCRKVSARTRPPRQDTRDLIEDAVLEITMVLLAEDSQTQVLLYHGDQQPLWKILEVLIY